MTAAKMLEHRTNTHSACGIHSRPHRSWRWVSPYFAGTTSPCRPWPPAEQGHTGCEESRALDEGTWESHLLGQHCRLPRPWEQPEISGTPGVCLASSPLAAALSPAARCALTPCARPPRSPDCARARQRRGSWRFLCCVCSPQTHILALTATFPFISPSYRKGRLKVIAVVNHPQQTGGKR